MSISKSVSTNPSVTSEKKYASFFRRVSASIYDSLIYMCIGIGISLALNNNPFQTTGKGINHTTDYLATLLIGAFYHVYFWVKHEGQTPGKKIMHIRIERENGTPIGWSTGFVRYISYYVSLFSLGIGYLWAIIDKKKQTWHDKIVGTVVVETDDQKPSKAVGCFAVLAFFLFILLMTVFFIIGLVTSLNKNNLKRIVSGSLNKSVTETNPQVTKLLNESQKYFDTMREIDTKITQNPEQTNALLAKLRQANDSNIEILKKAIKITPNNPKIWYQLGNAYTWISTEGSLQDGVNAYKEAEKLDPTNVLFINGVGDMLIRDGKYEEAVVQFQKTLRITNDSGYAHLSLARAYMKLNILENAKENYKKAIELFTKQNSDGSFDRTILDAQKELATISRN